MRFLFISSFLGPQIGGLETLIARMSAWLLARGHEVTLPIRCDIARVPLVSPAVADADAALADV